MTMELIGYTARGKARILDQQGREWMGDPESERVWLPVGKATPEEKAEMAAFFATILGSIRQRNEAEEKSAAAAKQAAINAAEAKDASRRERILQLQDLPAPSFAQRAELMSLQGAGSTPLCCALEAAAKAEDENCFFLGGRWGHTLLVKGLGSLSAEVRSAFLEGTLRHKAQSALAVRELDGCRASMRWTTDRRGRELAILDLSGSAGIVETSDEELQCGASLQITSTGRSRIWVRVK